MDGPLGDPGFWFLCSTEQVVKRRQNGGTITMVAQGLSWSPNEDTVVATVITQWTLLVGQRRHTGGTREAEASLKLKHNVYNSVHFLWGDQWLTAVHPFCDHHDAYAFLLPPLSNLWATDLLGDLCAIVLNVLKTSRWPWHLWQGLNILCTTLNDQGNLSASFVPSTMIWPVFRSHKGGTKVAVPVLKEYYTAEWMKDFKVWLLISK